MTPATAVATAAAAELLSGVKDRTTRIFVGEAAGQERRGSHGGQRDGGDEDTAYQVMLASALKGKAARRGTTFTIAGLESAPGRYMQGLLDDEEFDKYIVGEMRRYLEAKLTHGRRLSIKTHVKGLRHVPAGKQITYKLKKREHDLSRHGYARAKALAAAKQLGPLRKSMAVGADDEDG